MNAYLDHLDGLTIIPTDEATAMLHAMPYHPTGHHPTIVNGCLIDTIDLGPRDSITPRPIRLPETIRTGILTDPDNQDEISQLKEALKTAKNDGHTTVYHLFVNHAGETGVLDHGTIGQHTKRRRHTYTNTELGQFRAWIAIHESAVHTCHLSEHNYKQLLTEIWERTINNRAEHTHGLILPDCRIVAGFWSQYDLELTYPAVIANYASDVTQATPDREQLQADMAAAINDLASQIETLATTVHTVRTALARLVAHAHQDEVRPFISSLDQALTSPPDPQSSATAEQLIKIAVSNVADKHPLANLEPRSLLAAMRLTARH